jgi:hypothetical protein
MCRKHENAHATCKACAESCAACAKECKKHFASGRSPLVRLYPPAAHFLMFVVR